MQRIIPRRAGVSLLRATTATLGPLFAWRQQVRLYATPVEGPKAGTPSAPKQTLHPGVGGDVDASAGTHPDFQPKAAESTKENPEEIEAIKKDIRDTIRDEPVVVFIKGLPEAPVCGFSKTVVEILDALGVEYTSFDVLAHPIVRSYVKEVSNWPTLPQLFVKGQFVGGSEIVVEMADNGQLQLLLEKHKIAHRPGKVFQKS